ncbi:MAG: hypothetical protein RL211_1337 [Pseudomonadota bacterium]
MNVIFLAGVHGVGKGYLGAPAAKAAGITHCTASQLIREEKGLATWGLDKRTTDVDDNQRALIQAVNKLRALGDILLDGHFVLRNAVGLLTPLETSVFDQLKLKGVVLLTNDPKVIVERLANRDNKSPDEASIAELADAELSHAKHVCKALNLPLSVLHSPTGDEVVRIIFELLKP